jgi:hypothetical protein
MRADLKNLTFQLNHNKGKEKREDFWCTFCRTKGHHKNDFQNFAQYLGTRILNPLHPGGPWCEICRTHGHDPYHCPMMQKYQIVPNTTFCKFCKSLGHEDKDCRTLEIMKERKSDTYGVLFELTMEQLAQQPKYNNMQQFFVPP